MRLVPGETQATSVAVAIFVTTSNPDMGQRSVSDDDNFKDRKMFFTLSPLEYTNISYC